MYLEAIAPETAASDGWIAIAAGLAGVILTIIAGLVGAIVQGRREHRKWIREQRLRAYVDHLSATDNYLRAAQHDVDGSEFAAVTTDSIRALSVVQFVGPDRIADIATAYQDAAKKSVNQLLFANDPSRLDTLENDRLTKRRAFITAARKQVKI